MAQLSLAYDSVESGIGVLAQKTLNSISRACTSLEEGYIESAFQHLQEAERSLFRLRQRRIGRLMQYGWFGFVVNGSGGTDEAVALKIFRCWRNKLFNDSILPSTSSFRDEDLCLKIESVVSSAYAAKCQAILAEGHLSKALVVLEKGLERNPGSPHLQELLDRIKDEYPYV